MMSNHEVFENTVATFVDIGSIMVAYTVGIHQFNFFLGLAYALFDAIIVVWMRKPLSQGVRYLMTGKGRSSVKDAYVADLG